MCIQDTFKMNELFDKLRVDYTIKDKERSISIF
jgi:hypothetical protein